MIRSINYDPLSNFNSERDNPEEISEELNRGLSFSISETDEKTVRLAGKWMGWATTSLHGNKLLIEVDDTFFTGNILEQILTSLWANLLDFGEIRLEEFKLSDHLHALLDTPESRKQSGYELLSEEGPCFGTIFKPSFGLSLSEKLNISERFASIGGTFIKEDETYLVDKSRLLDETQAIQSTMNSFSSHCFYVPNVTAYLSDDRFLHSLYEAGIRVVMVNYLIAGLPNVFRAIKSKPQLLFWGHRVGYKAIERYISMKAVAQLAVYSGLDIIHIGTPHFWVDKKAKENQEILNAVISINPTVLAVFTKCSHSIVISLTKWFGKEIIVMSCGPLRTNGSLDWLKVKKMIDIIKR
jgi:ribulose 1,5-bisphosphate carboxylase large subunit-like protein